jgi:hypothetical protein
MREILDTNSPETVLRRLMAKNGPINVVHNFFPILALDART